MGKIKSVIYEVEVYVGEERVIVRRHDVDCVDGLSGKLAYDVSYALSGLSLADLSRTVVTMKPSGGADG